MFVKLTLSPSKEKVIVNMYAIQSIRKPFDGGDGVLICFNDSHGAYLVVETIEQIETYIKESISDGYVHPGSYGIW